MSDNLSIHSPCVTNNLAIVQEAWIGSPSRDSFGFTDIGPARLWYPEPHIPEYSVQWAGSIGHHPFRRLSDALDYIANELRQYN